MHITDLLDECSSASLVLLGPSALDPEGDAAELGHLRWPTPSSCSFEMDMHSTYSLKSMR